jgi:3'-phosphoadenosine 5'-phosphosulfate sulfotransferase (PAPS reductase)/FAD synthetase
MHKTQSTSFQVPADIDSAMRAGAALVISMSGGKDSQAVLFEVVSAYHARGWSGPLVAVHADLGRIEWEGTQAHAEKICAAAGVPLEVISAGDLIDRWQARREKLAGTDKPFWSSSQNRYCTSDLKRDPIDKLLRRYKLVVSVDGVRAEESPARAKRSPVEIRSRITAQRLRGLSIPEALQARGENDRLAINWSAIHAFQLPEVWESCGTSSEDIERRRALYREGREAEAFAGAAVHHAYIRGNTRLSCSICILASDADIQNGARHNPSVARELVRMEAESGISFFNKRTLASIISEVLAA